MSFIAEPCNARGDYVNLDHKDTNQSTDLVGLRGWLILVGIGIIVSPIRFALLLVNTYLPMRTDGTWEALTDPTSANFAPFWKPLLLSEIFVNISFIVIGIYMIVLFFEKKKQFPPWFIGFWLVNLVWIVADAVVVSMLVPGQVAFDSSTITELARSAIGCAIWVPYMLMSKRVKATFVN
jgi:hypothetical protein